MIAESLAAFINACAGIPTPSGFGSGGFGDGGFYGVPNFPYDLIDSAFVGCYVMTPDLIAGQIKAPCAIVEYAPESPEELWVVGDAFRKENPMIQVCFYGTSWPQVRDISWRFRRAIQAVKAYDDRDLLVPGIDFFAAADLLRDSGDQLTYLSDQPGWLTSMPVQIYKNVDSNGEPIAITSGFTIDYQNGRVVFDTPNLTTDKIRATYKMGVIDFNIAGVAHVGKTDVANNPERYLVAFDLETHFYIKSTTARYL